MTISTPAEPMTMGALLAALASAGARLTTHGGRLQVDAPQGALTPAVVDALRRHKPAILAALGMAPPPPKKVTPPSPSDDGLDPANDVDERLAIRWAERSSDGEFQRLVDEVVRDMRPAGDGTKWTAISYDPRVFDDAIPAHEYFAAFADAPAAPTGKPRRRKAQATLDPSA